MRLSKAQKAADKAFADAFRVQGNCIQFNIIDLGNLKSDTMAGIALGKTMEESLAEAITKYRKN
jgi:hypothetical protein